MTTEEAKEKECREVVMYSETVSLGNGETRTVNYYENCIANACAHWRWFDPAIKTEGYCGFSGKKGAE